MYITIHAQMAHDMAHNSRLDISILMQVIE
jgi:hypothetical protein